MPLLAGAQRMETILGCVRSVLLRDEPLHAILLTVVCHDVGVPHHLLSKRASLARN